MTTKSSLKLLKVCKDRNYDCVYLNKKKIILGRSGTPEAEAALRKLQIQILSDPTLSFLYPQQQITVDVLCLAYLQYAKESDPSHYFGIKTACTILLKNFGGQAIESLDSSHFLILQEKYVEHGVSRQYCNMLMGYIRRMLNWGKLKKMVSLKVKEEAKAVPPLKKGKKQRAPDKPKRKAVREGVVNRTLPYLLPTIRAIVQIQRATGARPSEICNMKVGEIDTKFTTQDGMNIWMYVPGTHKNAWREDDDDCPRIIPLGKPEQEIIAPRLIGKSDDDYVFSPRDTEQERRERDAARRKTKVQPSQLAKMRRNAKKPKRQRTPYTAEAYNRAIHRAIEVANKHLPDAERIPFWTPYMLRHSKVTNVIAEALNTARATVGQKSLATTQRYDHSDVIIAISQAVDRSR